MSQWLAFVFLFQLIVVPAKIFSNPPKNCLEMLETGSKDSTIYAFKASFREMFLAPCDMNTMGGGWTYIQKRFDGSVNFTRNWEAYVKGFGNLEGEFWLGLETIHDMTNFEPYELLLEIADFNGRTWYAHYDYFEIGDEDAGFRLNGLRFLQGNVTNDSLRFHLGSIFATTDRRKDDGCTNTFRGGWWYNACFKVNLNGEFLADEEAGQINSTLQGLRHWQREDGKWLSFGLKSTSMKIRPLKPNAHVVLYV